MFTRNGEVLGSVRNTAAPKVSPEPEPVEDAPVAEPPAPDEVETPPRNASREAWAAFLDEKGIEYDPDPEVDGRNDLISKWDAFEDNSGSEI